jgi:branched-subunit amino acid transport protein
MSTALLILGMALVNLAIRWPLFLFAGRAKFPPLIERGLAYVPTAVLGAIVAPAVVYPQGGTLDLGWRNPWLIAALVTTLASWLGGRLVLAVAIGMATFFTWQWLFGG